MKLPLRQKRKDFEKRKLKLYGLILIFLLLLLLVLGNLFKVKRINCLVGGKECPQLFQASLMALSLGKNMILLPSQKISEELRNIYPQIEKLKIKKTYPYTLDFDLEARRPQIAIAGEKYLLVDRAGVVVEKSDQAADLSVIMFEPRIDLNIGERIKQREVLETIEILTQLRFRMIIPKLTNIVNDRQIQVELDDDTLVIISLKKGSFSQLDSLQFILSRSKIENRKIKQIDLCFDKPVIVYY